VKSIFRKRGKELFIIKAVCSVLNNSIEWLISKIEMSGINEHNLPLNIPT
jgi:hypothetical protein